MIKSKLYWAGVILLAIIPLVVMDIPKHYVDWTREVHDETIEVVYNSYHFTDKQKAALLDNILDTNTSLMASMYLKGFAGVVLLFFSSWFFVSYRRQGPVPFWKAAGMALILLLISASLKTYSWYSFSGNDKIKMISYTPADTSLTHIYNINFKGKVVYVDFWGTTCGPCLEEFRTFTKPLKAKYHDRKDIAYLYICGGRESVWRQQLKKYDIQGTNIFLDAKQYRQLFKSAIRGDKDTLVAMPRYLIMDKQGKIVNSSAPRPSDTGPITTLLDKYLVVK
jgi:thiol-disulfide isomerase/thioredoxin